MSWGILNISYGCSAVAVREDADLPVGTGIDFSVCSTHHSAEMLVHVKLYLPLIYDVTLSPEYLTKKITQIK